MHCVLFCADGAGKQPVATETDTEQETPTSLKRNVKTQSGLPVGEKLSDPVSAGIPDKDPAHVSTPPAAARPLVVLPIVLAQG